MLSEWSIALNPKTSMLYCIQAMMAWVVVSADMAAGALWLILYVYVVLLAVYALLSPYYLLNNKVWWTTALAAIAKKAGMENISRFLNRRWFAFLMWDSVITMLITVTAAAATIAYLFLGSDVQSTSLIADPTNIRTRITMWWFTLIVLIIRAIQWLWTNRLGSVMSWIALVWTLMTLAISVPHIDINMFFHALNPMSIVNFV